MHRVEIPSSIHSLLVSLKAQQQQEVKQEEEDGKNIRRDRLCRSGGRNRERRVVVGVGVGCTLRFG